jgi:hypothetical protein
MSKAELEKKLKRSRRYIPFGSKEIAFETAEREQMAVLKQHYETEAGRPLNSDELLLALARDAVDHFSPNRETHAKKKRGRPRDYTVFSTVLRVEFAMTKMGTSSVNKACMALAKTDLLESRNERPAKHEIEGHAKNVRQRYERELEQIKADPTKLNLYEWWTLIRERGPGFAKPSKASHLMELEQLKWQIWQNAQYIDLASGKAREKARGVTL